jgi:hypothetical protein
VALNPGHGGRPTLSARGLRALGARDGFAWPDVVALLEREPALLDINRHVVQKDAREG